jgi:acetyltransferase-like isoleucine patch superfamily enzyme
MAENNILQYFNPFNLFIRCVDYNLIEHRLNLLKIKKCFKGVSHNSGVKFYEQASVYNMQNDRNNIRIASNTHIRSELLIFPYGGKIEIGEDCYLGEHSRIWSSNHIKIGNGVLVSHNVNIIDTNSHEINHLERIESYKAMLKVGHPLIRPNVISAPIEIGDYVWLNFNSVVLKGVKIGEGAIIAPGTIVNEDVPPYCIFAGNPGKVIKKIEG